MFQYPYGDSQQLNLDWLMEQWLETKASIDGSLQGEIDRVEAAITDLLTARDQAVAAQTAAETAATSASGYASTASGAASTATAQATAAAGSAALAGTHASNAQTSETNAGLQATAAGNSASAAAVSEGNARNSELAAAAYSSAAAGNALYAEGYAKGTQNGTPVTSGSPYYENNAKYYAAQAAQEAQDSADSATASAASASSAAINAAGMYHDTLNGKILTLTGSVTAGTGSNIRDIILNGNNLEVQGADRSGSTSFSYALTGSFEYVGSSYSNVIANIPANKFIPIEIPDATEIWLKYNYTVERLRANAGTTGMLIFMTRDPDTGDIFGTNVEGNSIGDAAVTYKTGSNEVCLTAILPKLATFKNIAIAFCSRVPCVNEHWSLSLESRPTTPAATSFYGTPYKHVAVREVNTTATRNYSINDFLMIGPNLYKVTQAINIGETIVPNTNVTLYRIGTILTLILNYLNI